MSNSTNFDNLQAWGQHTILNLSNCSSPLNNGEEIKSWVKEVASACDLKTYGEPLLEHFALHNPQVAGYSLIQLVETSNICAHFAENVGEVYIDVFSCKPFSEEAVLKISSKFFSPEKASFSTTFRGASCMENTRKEENLSIRDIEDLKTDESNKIPTAYLNENYSNKMVCEKLYTDVFQGFVPTETLYTGQTKFQKVAFYKNDTYGTVLMLDDILQTTEHDEFIYHESLTHVPIMSFIALNKGKFPRNVLIVGGGDGGILREVLKYENFIDNVTMVDIDGEVVELCQKYLPKHNLAGGVYSHPKSTLIVDDAFKYLADETNHFDVVIIDSTDPVGPGECLFSSDFFKMCRNSLSNDVIGIVGNQNAVPFYTGVDILKTSTHMVNGGFDFGSSFLESIPAYHGGVMTFAFGIAIGQNVDETNDFVAKLKELQTSGDVKKTSIALNKFLEESIEFSRESSLGYEKSQIETKHFEGGRFHASRFQLPKWVRQLVSGEVEGRGNYSQMKKDNADCLY